MRIIKFSTVCAAAVMSLVTLASAQAASPVTRFFLNNVVANVDFLEKSSRLALTRTDSAKVLAFAREEAAEQSTAASAIDLWSGTSKSPYVALASAEAPLQTGRSVAVTRTDEQVMPDTRVPLGSANLDRLKSLSGVGFDNLYWQQQFDALKQVETDYVSYIADGDDPVLRAIAERELPKIERRIEALSKL